MDTDIPMVMVMSIHMKKIDIHSHLLNNVDDGSKDLTMSEKMLKEYQKQDTKIIFLTPHVNSSVTKASRETHIKKYIILKEIAIKYGIELILGSEIYLSVKLPDLNYRKFQMGEKNILLVEFSPNHKTPIVEHCFSLIKKGFKIIIAHVERYNYLDFSELLDLKSMGVYFQVNASTIIKNSNRSYISKGYLLLKKGLIDFVATDAHNLSSRPPNIHKAFLKLEKKFGKEIASNLTFNNQNNLFFN